MHAIKTACIWQLNILNLFTDRFQKYLTFLRTGDFFYATKAYGRILVYSSKYGIEF